jgi:hypothetical protein
MSDYVGSIPLPIPVEANTKTDPTLEPTLTTLSAFLKASLNRQLAHAYKRVEAGTEGFVKVTHVHDPGDGKGLALNRGDLPALYICRETVLRSWWYTIDWRMRESVITVLWLPWTDPAQDRRKVVHAFLGPFDAALDVAVELGRDTAYKVRGDNEANAATQGSLIYTPLPGIFRLEKQRAERVIVEVSDAEGKPGVPLQYPGLQATFSLWERFDRDLAARYAELVGLDLTESLYTDPDDPLAWVSPGETLSMRDDFIPPEEE